MTSYGKLTDEQFFIMLKDCIRAKNIEEGRVLLDVLRDWMVKDWEITEEAADLTIGLYILRR